MKDFADTIPTEPAEFARYLQHLHRTTPACSGPCDQGDKPCPTPVACRVLTEDDGDDFGCIRGVLWSTVITAAVVVAIWAIIKILTP